MAMPSSTSTHGGPALHFSKVLKPHDTPWRQWVGPAISLGVLGAALAQVGALDIGRALALMPATPLFWLAFAGAYLALPASEWVIYRRLWRLPAGGLLPLLRKRISNEIFLGYSGEVYFYAWARRNAGIATAPFGAIKDVSILSAQAGNIATLALIGVAWPLLGVLDLGTHARELLLSGVGILLLSLPPFLLRQRLLSLPMRDLWWVGGIHMARILATLVLIAFLWHEALPTVALGWWVILSALRQLITRLPLLPNKDVVFAGVVAYLVGPHDDLVAMIAMTATLVLLVHVVLGALLAVADLATPGRQ